jgi:hypothetical protein
VSDQRASESGGVPARPAPLPPPRTLPPEGTEAARTVVPERSGRAAAPRPPLTRPAAPARGRRATLALRRFDPWSVFVTSLLVSLFLAIVTIVASIVLYGVLSALGVPHSINQAVTDVQGSGPLLTKGRFLGFGALIAAVDVVLLTGLCTLGAMLYNVCATFTGGIEVTLSERD